MRGSSALSQPLLLLRRRRCGIVCPRPLQSRRGLANDTSSSSTSSNTSSSSSPAPSSASTSASTSKTPRRRNPPSGPKPVIDIRHIRKNPELYEKTCLERNYPGVAGNPRRIVELHARRTELQRDARTLRERANELQGVLTAASRRKSNHGDKEAATTTPSSSSSEASSAELTRQQALDEARRIKTRLNGMDREDDAAAAEMHALALALPNLTHPDVPRGEEPVVLGYINCSGPPGPVTDDESYEPKLAKYKSASNSNSKGAQPLSHMQIGNYLHILDFTAGATCSGWGFYYLVSAGAQLEQALVQYALSTASQRGWIPVSPPSLVYSHVGAACGFHPRDQHDEQQTFTIAQSPADTDRGVPPRSLAATAEIPLAGMAANTTLDPLDLPRRHVAASRCFRAEAGARGAEAKGLYRVHEFTKVELFAWTKPDPVDARRVLDDMVALQVDLLESLGLPCRVLVMPARDLGASAAYKVDIEVWFPSRKGLRPSRGWGEVTSASLCTDYQARRLATRLPTERFIFTTAPSPEPSSPSFPYTVNATALAVPRVLAALLEHGYDDEDCSLAIPKCLRPWMDGRTKIGGWPSPPSNLSGV